MSFPEVLLWQELRKEPEGLQFRRQHPAGPYVLDFFCATANLAIEIDGEAHNRADQPQRDQIRDKWLNDQDVQVVRIAAVEVLENLDAVVRLVVAAANAR